MNNKQLKQLKEKLLEKQNMAPRPLLSKYQLKQAPKPYPGKTLPVPEPSITLKTGRGGFDKPKETIDISVPVQGNWF